MVLDPAADISSGKTQIALSANNKIKPLLRNMQLLDLWRILHPSTRDFTFYSGVHGSYSRIDYFLTSHHIMDWRPRASIGARVFSDHALICINLRLLDFLHPICLLGD